MKKNNYFRQFSGGLLALLLVAGSFATKAQMTVVIGANNGINGTTDYPCPIQDFYYATRAQYLFTAAELSAVGVTPGGHIDSIGWIVEATSIVGMTLENYTIALKNTSTTTLDLGVWETGVTNVYGPITYNYPDGYAGNVMFPTTPFTYTGGNLIVEICGGISTGGYISNPMCQWTTGLAFNGSHQWHQDVADGCGQIDVTNYGIQTNRPVMVMTYTCPAGTITAGFSTSTNNPPLNVDVAFTDQSTSNTIGWLWDFGDGNTSPLQNPTHAYTTPGTYYVSLNAIGCSTSDMAYDTITVQNAPSVTITPDSLSANLACGDSITFQVTVDNNGTGELVYSTGGSTNAQVRLLALKYGTDAFSEYPATLAAINTYFTNYTLTETTTTDPAVLSNLLVANNVLLIPEQESGDPAVFTTFAYAINSFLLTGGTVIQCGASQAKDACITNTGLWTKGTYTVVDVGLGGLNQVVVDSPGTPLTTGLSGNQFYAPTAAWANMWTNSDKHMLIEYQGKDIVSYRNVGGGKAIFVCFDYYGSNDDTKKIIANAVQWGGQSGLPSWITIDQNSDTVGVGSSSIMNVTFHATGLPAGTYYGIIGVTTNDPNNPYVTVACTLTVTGGPIVMLSDSCVDFGTIMENTTAQQTFTLTNSGCDSLVVTNISAATGEYTISGAPSLLLPGASAQVTVTFSPLTTGTFSSSITIQNNAGDTTFCLTGSAGPAPVINTVASVSNQILSCTGTTTSNFSIGNTGGSDLNYTITGVPSWAQLSSTSGTVPAAGSQNITVTFNAAGLNDGTYSTNITVTTNDPVTPTVTISLTLTVDGDPVVAMSVTCVNFTPIFEGATAQQTFTIMNTGCDTLDVTGLVPSLPEYTTSAAPGSILPGGSATITVTFHPLVFGSYNGTLLIQNSDVDTTICLTGDGLIAPHINPNATFAVNQNVPACNGTDSTTFIIYNSGGSDLNFTITGIPSWASLSTTSGTVSAGDTLVITVVMNSGLLAGGTQTANLTIASNDPVTPNVGCTLSMLVGTNPCFTAGGNIDACTGIGTFTTTVIVNAPTSWAWDFGDGGTANTANPIHQFSAAAGTSITVSVIGCTGGGCDTEYVSLTMPLVTGPAAAACLPQTQDPSTGGSLGLGITLVQLASISNSSVNASAGYQNFTCTDTTTLTAGIAYAWSVTTGQTYEETVKGYIDFDNNGAFAQSELVFEDSAVLHNHNGTTVTMPANPPVIGTALRMRIESEYSGNPEPDGCIDLLYGQCEDYTVFMQGPVGIGGIASATSFNVYPNPFNRNTTIEYTLNSSQKVSVEIFNAVGKKISVFASAETQAAGKHTYRFSESASGIYFVKLTVGDASTMVKLVNMQ